MAPRLLNSNRLEHRKEADYRYEKQDNVKNRPAQASKQVDQQRCLNNGLTNIAITRDNDK